MKFIPGKKLSRLFFEQVIQPLLSVHFPNLIFSAAQLDWGSDVIDQDTPMSMDHGWGPRLTLYLNQQDFETHGDVLDNFFANNLPFKLKGFPTHFNKAISGSFVMEIREKYPIHHMITITTPERFFQKTLGVDIHQPMTPPIWLTIPQQRLLTVRSGDIFHDGLGELDTIRNNFNWYPNDLWRYLLANQWLRIDQDAPFLGRTGVVHDELGSRLLAARLITDLMHLAFLMERRYAPYRKWFGSVFNKLDLAPSLSPILESILEARDWKTRESHLTEAYLIMIKQHNALGLTQPIPIAVEPFHDRPFLVPPAGRIIEALLESIQDPDVRALPPHLGSVNQISDNTDLLDEIPRCQALRDLYH